MGNRETWRTEPRSPARAAYARLPEGLAPGFPAPPAAVPAVGPAPEVPGDVRRLNPGAGLGSGAAPRQAAAWPTAPDAAHSRLETGPFAVAACEDGQVSAYRVGGPGLDVPAKGIGPEPAARRAGSAPARAPAGP
ncbi:hypothetical protein GCM10010259_62720 [Streptomyces daghestanicus]|uniref:Uncharacterized protein n=1 Tax=Streptomyces daghestanicus TaxID=66885 RepID=A0ABQ3PYC1_9ACTN|nr:hypothetical protein GCM10010259_62720 [Streptomyces daghestanicus]GHI30031.1 hypothetical protein Sdagh_17610 [Streptomyces daghestanicus]